MRKTEFRVSEQPDNGFFWFIMEFGWLILAVLIAIGVIFYLSLINPSYKITINECHNETQSYSEYLTDSNYNLEQINKYLDIFNKWLVNNCTLDSKDTTCKNLKVEIYNIPDLKKAGLKEVCNKIEVEEIEYMIWTNASRYRTKEEFCDFASNHQEEYTKECMFSGMYEYDMEHNPETNLIITDTLNGNEKTISKSDITKEWLNSNCECVNKTTDKYCHLICNEENYKEKFNVVCNRYKCFDNYEVEVL